MIDVWKGYRKKAAVLAATMCLSMPVGFAQSIGYDDIDQMILEQQRALDELVNQKKSRENDALLKQIDELQRELGELRRLQSEMAKEGRSKYDAQGAVESLSQQLADLRGQIEAQTNAQKEILDRLEAMKAEREKKEPAFDSSSTGDGNIGYANEYHRAYGSSAKYLVNPAPSGEVSYTQDAINSQGNSTMVFRYAPNQLYKIYCRTGYLTDLAFRKGEKITFAGGGDTAGWAVNSTTVDGVPHLYIKPVVETSATNLIVTTDHHSYQLILQTAEWYNPMVVWSYDLEDANQNLIAKRNDEKTVTSGLNVTNPENLYFDYEIKGNGSFKPTMVFDDGSRTIIRFRHMDGKLPVLFGKERGKKLLSMVNYRIKDNCYIVDKVFSEAELRMSEKEIVRIKRK